jgi:hypothetical protein
MGGFARTPSTCRQYELLEQLAVWTHACEISVAAALHDCFDPAVRSTWLVPVSEAGTQGSGSSTGVAPITRAGEFYKVMAGLFASSSDFSMMSCCHETAQSHCTCVLKATDLKRCLCAVPHVLLILKPGCCACMCSLCSQVLSQLAGALIAVKPQPLAQQQEPQPQWQGY